MNTIKPWIYSPRFDAWLFLGSVLAPAFLYATFYYLQTHSYAGRPEALALFIFTVFSALFDSPHILMTLSRTHFDSREWRRHKWLHLISLPLILFMVFAAEKFNRMGEFLFVLGLYGAWHITRQNIGLLKLYQTHAKTRTQARSILEVRLLYVLLLYFLLSEFNSVHEWREAFKQFELNDSILEGLALLTGLVLVALLLRWVWLAWPERTKTLKQPSTRFFLFNFALFSVLMRLQVHPLVMTALATVAHNIQYQGWMWAYHRRCGFSRARAPAALILCMTLGIALALASEQVLFVAGTAVITWGSFYNGLVFWHYFIDGEIWKLSTSPELASLKSRVTS